DTARQPAGLAAELLAAAWSIAEEVGCLPPSTTRGEGLTAAAPAPPSGPTVPALVVPSPQEMMAPPRLPAVRRLDGGPAGGGGGTGGGREGALPGLYSLWWHPDGPRCLCKLSPFPPPGEGWQLAGSYNTESLCQQQADQLCRAGPPGGGGPGDGGP